ncbi:hypothetical protein ACH5RR_000977 [Cinchona calisaya]|uniref:BZIP domain-containing protein n=1 Tax=Cinchona calisaya TaxID=153742 RepID=A0ABD3B2G9_9GENT
MNDKMDDGEVEVSDHVLIPNSDSSSNIHASVSVDSFLDELLRNSQTCTHTHTCNPVGLDAAHPHTCYHTHTQVIPSEKVDVPNLISKSRKPSGNREAVRKYREKKKAHTVYLEGEVKKLSFVNQQLIRKVQSQAILEAEILRLRGLFLDLRGKIDNELAVYPSEKKCNSCTTLKKGDCRIEISRGILGMQCENELTCFHPQESSSMQSGGVGECDKIGASCERNCQSAIVECQGNGNAIGVAERCCVETMVSSACQAE